MCSSCRMLLEYCVCQWWQAQVTQSAQVCGRCSTRLLHSLQHLQGLGAAVARSAPEAWSLYPGGGGGGQRVGLHSGLREWAPGQPHFLQKANPGRQWNEAQASFRFILKCACAECHSNEESSQDALTGGQGVELSGHSVTYVRYWLAFSAGCLKRPSQTHLLAHYRQTDYRGQWWTKQTSGKI